MQLASVERQVVVQQPLSDLLPLCSEADDDEADSLKVKQKTTPRLSEVSLNMWGDCSPSNYAKTVRRARLFKPARLALFTLVKLALESAGIEYALYGGSALAVYRESGRMIAHDSDIDLVAREVDFARLVEVGERLVADSHGEVALDANCSLSGRPWLLPADDDGSISGGGIESGSGSGSESKSGCASGQQHLRREVAYDGRGCKRVKFALTQTGWAAAGLAGRRFPYDPCFVHLDVFTVSPHPLDPAGSLRVNWSVPGLYDPLSKQFPADCLFPAEPCVFERVATYAPRHLAVYLTVEYGYLGRDAMYDSATGLYVQMPPELRARLGGMARAGLTAQAAEVEVAGEA